MMSKLLIVTLFAAYNMLSGIAATIEYDSDMKQVIEDHNNIDYNNNAIKKQDEHTRQLQATPYFNTASTSTLGDRNYNASYGNPLKGLGATEWSPEFTIDHAIEYTYAPLTTVLKDFDTYDWTAFETTLNGVSSRNRQLVPRFFITYPPYEPSLPISILKTIQTGTYNDFGSSNAICPIFDDPNLLNVLQKFIAAFGAKYNGDKRIAYVQPGLIGFWGEYHTMQNPFLSQATRDSVTTWFKQAFPTTPMMVRYPSAVTKALNVGYHDDSFTWSTIDGIYNGEPDKVRNSYFWPSINNFGHGDAWKFAPIGGETRPENVPWALKQDFPAGTFNKQDFWECAKITHAVYMKYGYFSDGYSLEKGIMIHTNMGYNYQLRQVSAVKATSANKIDVSVTIEQIGYTPFYYPLSIAFKCKGAIIQTVPGVEKLIDQYQTGVFTFRDIPVDSSCLSSVQFTLESNNIPSLRPVKWAQGTSGTVTINIPLPTGGSNAVAVPTPVAIVKVASMPVATVNVVPVANKPVSVNKNDIVFYLANADTNKDVKKIVSMNQFSFKSLGTKNLNIRVDVPSTTKSITFTWTEDNGSKASRDETSAPFLMGGNTGTDYFSVGYLSTIGTKTITAIAKDSNGVAFFTKSIRLVLKN